MSAKRIDGKSCAVTKKPYVQAATKIEALLDALIKWRSETPSPNEIVEEKSGAKRSDKKRQ
jgi:hypothetical protein